MASTIKFFHKFTYTNSTTGKTVEFGSVAEPLSVSLSGDTYHWNTFSVATGNTKELLRCGTSAGDDLAAFTFLYIVSDKALTLELLVGGAAANNSNVPLVANEPFILFSDNGLEYSASGGFAGVAGDITKINANNVSGSTANISVFAAN